MRHAEGLQKAVWYIRHRAAAASFRSLLQQRRRQTWQKLCTDLATQDFCKTTATVKRIRQNRQTHAVFTDSAGPSAAADRMVTHVGTVFDGSFLPSDRAVDPEPLQGPHSLDDCPCSPEVVQDALDGVARRKAPRIDHLRAEMPALINLFRLCWRSSRTPLAWRVAQVVPIHKEGPATDPANFRPISLLSVLRPFRQHPCGSPPGRRLVAAHPAHHWHAARLDPITTFVFSIHQLSSLFPPRPFTTYH
ncbi:hypothetical protein BCR43DRAFT_269450 [Syncephalastrum racemosum]|uniref:Uncharacterized protein n=1 Tax=Syncephalastrum racemosum TaxID=13706 RepID=A0A1X2HBP6_SYNRA|nr:hypothetical protein BCR43DRAFT_269450 [Syncephalastrum racemosum]